MLSHLRVRDLAIADDLTLELGAGLTVITGETGAGKSLLLEALRLVLGARASGKVVRAGAAQAEVEAQFTGPLPDEVIAALRARGIPHEDDELIVRRVVGTSGMRRIHVNGRLATRADLAAVTAPLVDLSTQHAHHRLFRPDRQRDALDRFAGAQGTRAAYEAAFRAWHETKTALRELDEQRAAREERLSYLRFVRDELQAAELRDGELDTLRTELRRIQAAERLTDACAAGAALLDGDDGGVRAEVGGFARTLERLAEGDDALFGLAERATEVAVLAEELARDLERFAADLDRDEARLSEIHARVDTLHGLLRKYGGSESAAIARLQAVTAELATLDEVGGDRERLAAALPGLARAAVDKALTLRAQRVEAASRLQAAIEEVLGRLGMELATMHVSLAGPGLPGEHAAASAAPTGSPPDAVAAELEADALGPGGAETVRFLLRANPGEAAGPLAEVASGGELSRVLLGLERACAQADPVPTSVYDEVDAGLSGSIGMELGRYLADLAQHEQVVVISHLPQVAAAADAHIHVRKEVHAGRTRSVAALLSTAERRQELARMLGEAGDASSAASHADKLIAAQRGSTPQPRP